MPTICSVHHPAVKCPHNNPVAFPAILCIERIPGIVGKNRITHKSSILGRLWEKPMTKCCLAVNIMRLLLQHFPNRSPRLLLTIHIYNS